MQLVDSHCHFDLDAFDTDRCEVLRRARDAGLMAQVIPAITAARFNSLSQMCAAEPDLHPAYGLHPVFLAEHSARDIDALRERLQQHDAVAVGECGLDHFVDGLDRERQQHYFEAQLELAGEFGLPLIIHARRAVDQVLKALRQRPGLRGVVHSFAGSQQQAEQLHELGFMVGIGGPCTYPRAQKLRRTIAAVPLSMLLLETDSPDQPPCGHQGERNEPHLLTEIASAIAGIRAEPLEDIARATTRNACELFGIATDSVAPAPLPD